MNRNLINFIALLAALLFSVAAQAQFWKQQQQTLLPDHQAFMESAEVVDNALVVTWQIADDYYMYRDQFSVVTLTTGASFGSASYPQGVIENDPEFGEVVVYFNRVQYSLPVTALPREGNTLELELKGQGCNKPVGVCYAPQSRLVSVGFERDSFKASSQQDSQITPANTDTKPNQLKSSGVEDKSFWAYILAAFGAGLLLSFTPCVLPMIPILAGIIARQQQPSRMQSGWLAICYVVGTIVTYAIAGWVAGASGTQLQAYFQNPWVIATICLFLLLLAASLFGAFKIQLPSSVQTKLSGTSVNNRSASVSSFTLGLISALVVGACVSPVLILTIGAAISKGDPVLGAAIMSAMALGMGSLLILFGFGAGWLLPKTGPWMNQIQVLFGFMVLGVAIFIASALPAVPALYLWAALLLWAGTYLLRIAADLSHHLFASLFKAMGIAALIWGGVALIGATTGGSRILAPLESLQLNNSNAMQKQKVVFNTVTSLDQAKALLEQARVAGKPSLVDFYADWCLDCKRMDRTTFTRPAIHQALADWQLIKIDVTQTNEQSQAVKRHFEVFGPPATLFFKADGLEDQTLRQYGYLEESEFLELAQALTP